MVKGKGTQHFGKKHQRTHTQCRRCGVTSFHKQKKQCARCGFPSTKMRQFNWSEKVKGRRGQGTGRMRYMKDLPRKAANGFMSGTVAKKQQKA